jgi:hypothetical protein
VDGLERVHCVIKLSHIFTLHVHAYQNCVRNAACFSVLFILYCPFSFLSCFSKLSILDCPFSFLCVVLIAPSVFSLVYIGLECSVLCIITDLPYDCLHFITAELEDLRDMWIFILFLVNALWLILIITVALKLDLIIFGSSPVGMFTTLIEINNMCQVVLY